MPRRVVKRFRYEAVLEGERLSPGEERRLWRVSVPGFKADLQRWRAAPDDLERFYAAAGAAMGAYYAEDGRTAEAIAREGLALAEKFRDNWNFGNTVHYCHTVLGLLALERGATSIAAAELLESVHSSGSPQLNSFGPSMRLAKELLRHGERKSVLQFFARCRDFWSTGGRWLDIWEHKVRRAEIPTFLAQGAK